MYGIITFLHTPVRLWAVTYRGVVISLTAQERRYYEH